MALPHRELILQRKVLMKSKSGKEIRQTRIHNPSHAIQTGWAVAGKSMHDAMQEINKPVR